MLAPSALSEFSGWPAIDTAEDENSYTVRVDVPGIDPKDVELEVSGNVLSIRGSRQDEWSDENKKRGIIRRERRSGSFLRSLPLPDYVDAEKVEARYENGTLTVMAPKIAGKGSRRVPVTV
ncbi:MAG TPA: Hsp20/alpha crystallin family protein [Tepidisphaeraceae bacterium]|nr:Hsp20/alpha crystallin family protein [Tepidisphaeraceae bacterium]